MPGFLQSKQSKPALTLALCHHSSNGSRSAGRKGCFTCRKGLSYKWPGLRCWGVQGCFYMVLVWALFLGWRNVLAHPSILEGAGSWHTERSPEMSAQLILRGKKSFSEGIGTRIQRILPGSLPGVICAVRSLWSSFWCLTWLLCLFPNHSFRLEKFYAGLGRLGSWGKLDLLLSPPLPPSLSLSLPPFLLSIFPSSVFSFFLWAPLFPTSLSSSAASRALDTLA